MTKSAGYNLINNVFLLCQVYAPEDDDRFVRARPGASNLMPGNAAGMMNPGKMSAEVLRASIMNSSS